ncbi:MAG: LON peptidase substrate-binding domain-containing protein [Candidatus Thiodiazotropha sp.]
MQSPFIQTFDQLPDTLPIFPLEGAVVMPGAQLPLNIFEPRYLNMIEDALASHHLIGMIQPEARDRAEDDAVHTTGCAGRISSYQETYDGRIEVVLSGVCRFDIQEELPTTRGYRLVIPDWSRFELDYDYPHFEKSTQQERFFDRLEGYMSAQELSIDSGVIHEIPLARLMNILTTLLPLHHADKQAIIEAVSYESRYNLLVSQFERVGSGAPSHLRH